MCLAIRNKVTLISRKNKIFGFKEFSYGIYGLGSAYFTSSNLYKLYETDKGITISAPLNEQKVTSELECIYIDNGNNKSDIKYYTSVNVNQLGIHFFSESINDYITIDDLHNWLNNIITDLKGKWFYPHTIHFLVYAPSEEIQLTGINDNAITKLIIIPSPKIFNELVDQLDGSLDLKRLYKEYYDIFKEKFIK